MAKVKKNCWACAHSYMEPDDMTLICGHKDSGVVGTYVSGIAPDGKARGPAAHCGPKLTKFKQHPLRNPDGSLKNGVITPKKASAG